MKRNLRLNRSSDFERVRRYGKSYAHPFVVLLVLENDQSKIRIGVSASKSIGGAVQRNRVKRVLREASRQCLDQIEPGYDLVFLARKALLERKTGELVPVIRQLIHKAALNESDDREIQG